MDEKKVREAIKELKSIMRTYKDIIVYAKDMDMKIACKMYEERIQVYETAIEALEKQLPKKPIENEIRGGWLNRQKYYTCPTCGNRLLTEMMNERQNTRCCWDCGQKLDWSEE